MAVVVILCGCPTGQPTANDATNTVTGKVIISGNIFADESTKSLGSAGLAHLKWLMASKVDRIQFYLDRSVSCEVQGDGSYTAEIEVPVGDYDVDVYAMSDDFFDDLFRGNFQLTVKPHQENIVDITLQTQDSYYVDVAVLNTPGVFNGVTGYRPAFFEDDAGNMLPVEYGAFVQNSGDDALGIVSSITTRIQTDAVIKGIHITDDSGSNAFIECNFSLIDKMMSEEHEGQIRLDYGLHGNVEVNVNLGLKEPPTLALTSNDDGTITAVFSEGDFFFSALYEEWRPKTEKAEKVLYPQINLSNRIYFGDSTAYQYQIIAVGQPLAISQSEIVLLGWYAQSTDGYSWGGDYNPQDILATIDGTPLHAVDGWWILP